MDRDALAAECARIERTGGSVLDFLRERGCISPWGTWYRLQLEELGRKRYQVTDGKGRPEKKKEKDPMKKMTLENKKKAVQIALDGGNPLKYLKDIGMWNPSASWVYIKNGLKSVDPEKYALLPESYSLKKKEPEKKEEPEKSFVPANQVVALEEEPEPVEKIQVQMDEIKPRPVTCGRFDISAVRSAELGEFYYDQKCGTLDWRDLSGDEISMAPIGWRNLLEDLPKIMDILGI